MSNAPTSLDPGAARNREDAAKARRAKYQSTPEIRAQLASVLEARDALREKQQTDTRAEREVAPGALRSVLARGTVSELAEIARMIGRLDGRRMQDLVNEVFRTKTRTAYSPALETPAEASSESETSFGRRKR
ncbi:hypothetical protein ACFZ8E_23410 [Methylobacterium sp. HMF5984]|uniref:hypothetical protein n=1 Tax=Methylobacterium sp. HMF5984 TaxID=3367370 RepID=UPI003855418A